VKQILRPLSYFEKMKKGGGKNFSRINRRKLAKIRKNIREERKVRETRRKEKRETFERMHTKYDHIKSRFRAKKAPARVIRQKKAPREQKLILPSIHTTRSNARKNDSDQLHDECRSYLERRREEWSDEIFRASRSLRRPAETSNISKKEQRETIVSLTRGIERVKHLLLTVPLSSGTRATNLKRRILENKLHKLEDALKQKMIEMGGTSVVAS